MMNLSDRMSLSRLKASLTGGGTAASPLPNCGGADYPSWAITPGDCVLRHFPGTAYQGLACI